MTSSGRGRGLQSEGSVLLNQSFLRIHLLSKARIVEMFFGACLVSFFILSISWCLNDYKHVMKIDLCMTCFIVGTKSLLILYFCIKLYIMTLKCQKHEQKGPGSKAICCMYFPRRWYLGSHVIYYITS